MFVAGIPVPGNPWIADWRQSFILLQEESIEIHSTYAGGILGLCAAISLLLIGMAWGQNPSFHNAPATASETKNPLSGKVPANAKQLYLSDCSKCHGDRGAGMGNIPALAHGPSQSATDGEVILVHHQR
jgi:mono/diheme cytochrome c family protein